MKTFRIDEGRHEYWLDGVRLPSVTEILKTLGLSRNYEKVSPFYAERGKAVHKACEYVDKGTLDDASLDDRVVPYVEAYRRFVADTGYRPSHWELPLYHEGLGFAGTLDKVGFLNGRRGILDIKVSDGSLDSAVERQLCGYQVLWNAANPNEPIAWKYPLQLKGNGKYELVVKYGKATPEIWEKTMKAYSVLPLCA